MLLAFFADIHANRPAFAACLQAARARGAERIVLIGDYVGYGADPEWTVDTVMGLVAQGALAVSAGMAGVIILPPQAPRKVTCGGIRICSSIKMLAFDSGLKP